MDIAKAVSDALEMPYDIMLVIPKITIVGNKSIHIENYTALIEYKKENIKLKYKGGVIEICGRDFEIKTIGEGNVVISGKISSIKLV